MGLVRRKEKVIAKKRQNIEVGKKGMNGVKLVVFKLHSTFNEMPCKLTPTKSPPRLHHSILPAFPPQCLLIPRPLTPGKFTLSTLTIFFLFSPLYAWWITISHYHSYCRRAKNNNLNSRQVTCASRLRVRGARGLSTRLLVWLDNPVEFCIFKRTF